MFPPDFSRRGDWWRLRRESCTNLLDDSTGTDGRFSTGNTFGSPTFSRRVFGGRGPPCQWMCGDMSSEIGRYFVEKRQVLCRRFAWYGTVLGGQGGHYCSSTSQYRRDDSQGRDHRKPRHRLPSTGSRYASISTVSGAGSGPSPSARSVDHSEIAKRSGGCTSDLGVNPNRSGWPRGRSGFPRETGSSGGSIVEPGPERASGNG